jgi:antitoxin (DNA-binding transcriptional repressor) of toxin-antitoxin stability system
MSGEDQAADGEQTLTLDDLRVRLDEVIRDIAAGRTFVLISDDGRQVGRLVRPPATRPSPEPRPPDPRLERLAQLLSSADLARALGLPTMTLAARQVDGRLTTITLARLTTLSLLIAELETVHTAETVRRWLLRPRPDFGRRSVLDALAFYWTPGDATHLKVAELIRRERYRRTVLSPHPGRRST